MQVNWIDDFSIRVSAEGGAITVSANREGMLSLAELCRTLAGEAPGTHIHLDQYNSLSEGSAELILERTE